MLTAIRIVCFYHRDGVNWSQLRPLLECEVYGERTAHHPVSGGVICAGKRMPALFYLRVESWQRGVGARANYASNLYHCNTTVQSVSVLTKIAVLTHTPACRSEKQ